MVEILLMHSAFVPPTNLHVSLLIKLLATLPQIIVRETVPLTYYIGQLCGFRDKISKKALILRKFLIKEI